MNTGIIASRYAKALLMLVEETGAGEVVVSQAGALLRALASVPELRRLLSDPSVPSGKKVSLLETVVAVDSSVASLLQNDTSDPGTTSHPGSTCHPERSEGSLSPELLRLFSLLVRNGRIGDISLILSSFETEYYNSLGIVRGRLRLSHPKDSATGELEEKIKTLIESKTGKSLRLVTETDESLIGGFVLEVEDRLLDASVSRQLELIRRQFIEKNRRIV